MRPAVRLWRWWKSQCAWHPAYRTSFAAMGGACLTDTGSALMSDDVPSVVMQLVASFVLLGVCFAMGENITDKFISLEERLQAPALPITSVEGNPERSAS